MSDDSNPWFGVKCSVLDAIAGAMACVSESDWEKIYSATTDRLIATEFDGEDTRSNRVLCEMIVSNILLDIRDARSR